MQNNRTIETKNEMWPESHSQAGVGGNVEELKAALKNAAFYCPAGMTSAESAAEFYRSNEDFVQPFMQAWAIEKMARIIARYRTKTRREASQQLAFEGMLGFKWLPEKLESKPGKFVPRAKSTISGFQRWARDLRQKDSTALRYANRAIALMKKYTKNKRRITWEEVCRKELE